MSDRYHDYDGYRPRGRGGRPGSNGGGRYRDDHYRGGYKYSSHYRGSGGYSRDVYRTDRDSHRDQRDQRDPREHREPRDQRDPRRERERDPRDRNPRERDPRERDPRDRDPREHRERDIREHRERDPREHREREGREKEVPFQSRQNSLAKVETRQKQNYTNPWILVLSIKDEHTQRNLEKTYVEATATDKALAKLQSDRYFLSQTVLALDRALEREALHVQITTEKLDEFTYL